MNNTVILSENNSKNTLCTPTYRNFFQHIIDGNEDLNKSPYYKDLFLDNFAMIVDKKERLEECGSQKVELVRIDPVKVFEKPLYCDNRFCDDTDCQTHRRYKYIKEHFGQIVHLKRTIEKPKGYVATGWKIPLHCLDRDFIKEKSKLLFNLLKKYSGTEFSMHLEIKVYPRCNENGNRNKNYGMCYIHYHIVSGFIDIKGIQDEWGRKVRYEKAIKPHSLDWYVSKYASKTPFFDDDCLRDYYIVYTFKLIMHRYSVKKLDIRKDTNFILMENLIRDVKRELYKSSYKNAKSSDKYFFAILEDDKEDLDGDYFV